MTDQPVLFLDSGIGGIPYCRHFIARNPYENIVYVADRKNFPYGNREKEELASILINLTEKLIKAVNPKIAVLVCNTATLAALSELRERFQKLPFVGTVPAIKPAALASQTGRIGVLGTELTINEPYIRELAVMYGNGEIFGIGAPELVEFVETRINTASAEEKKTIVKDYLNRFRDAGIDTLVLGCTHFLFLQEEFQREAAPDITVFDSVAGITHRIESLLKENFPEENTSPDTHRKNSSHQNHLLLTGTDEPESSWITWAERLGFSLSLLEES